MEESELHQLVHTHIGSLQEMLQELFQKLIKRIDKLDTHLDEIFQGLERICSRLERLERLLKTKSSPEEDKEPWTAADDELPSV